MYSPVDEIKNRLDILDVIGSYIRLQKAGRNFRALCPFHGERTPSFMVSPERQTWKCFGCNRGGDIFSFVMEIEGVEFGDALRTLAQRAGVILKRQDIQLRTQRKRLYEICELAVKFFQKQLVASNIGKKALEYLSNERGLEKKTIEDWRLGFAPDSWHGLEEFLQKKEYKPEEVFQVGLIVKKESSDSGSYSNYYDRFRSRIIFPIFDISGQVVGFAGRIFGKEDDHQGKYINTPQTLIYDKSKILYGLDKAKIEIRNKNLCILVEGNLDVIMSYQAGVKNVIACSGTALTENHLKIIKRYTDNIAFCFDEDEAGNLATLRAIELSFKLWFNISIIRVPEKDPADLIKKNYKNWQNCVDNAISFMEYYFQIYFQKYDAKSARGKKELGKVLLPLIKKIDNKIEQIHWLQELAIKLHIPEKILSEQLKSISLGKIYRDKETEMKEKIKKSRKEFLEERLINLLLANSNKLELVKKIKSDIFCNHHLRTIFDCLKEWPASEDFNVDQLKKKLDTEFTGIIDNSLFEQDKYPLEEKELDEEIRFCIQELKKYQIKQKLTNLSLRIKEAEKENKKQELKILLNKFKNLSKKLIFELF